MRIQCNVCNRRFPQDRIAAVHPDRGAICISCLNTAIPSLSDRAQWDLIKRKKAAKSKKRRKPSRSNGRKAGQAVLVR